MSQKLSKEDLRKIQNQARFYPEIIRKEVMRLLHHIATQINEIEALTAQMRQSTALPFKPPMQKLNVPKDPTVTASDYHKSLIPGTPEYYRANRWRRANDAETPNEAAQDE